MKLIRHVVWAIFAFGLVACNSDTTTDTRTGTEPTSGDKKIRQTLRSKTMRNEMNQLLRLINEMKADHKRLEKSHEEFRASAFKIGSLFESLHKEVKRTAALVTGPGSNDRVLAATRKMQEMNMSFNLQYLNLQQKMQAENKQFTLLSNIMKTKHDTARNAINDVR